MSSRIARNKETGQFQVEIKGLAEPKSKEAARICQGEELLFRRYLTSRKIRPRYRSSVSVRKNMKSIVFGAPLSFADLLTGSCQRQRAD
jgi:hypothetical protein